MNWLWNSISAHILWGAGPIFATLASYYHGDRSENILFAFETGVMFQLTIILYLSSGIDFSIISLKSSSHAYLAATCSSVAYYLMILAIRQSPSNLFEISLISGTWPACTAIFISIILMVKPGWLPDAKPASLINWAGVVLVLVGLFLINWKSGWIDKLRTFFS